MDLAVAVDVAADIPQHRERVVGVALLSEFDTVCVAVLGDEVVQVVVDGFAGAEEFMAE